MDLVWGPVHTRRDDDQRPGVAQLVAKISCLGDGLESLAACRQPGLQNIQLCHLNAIPVGQVDQDGTGRCIDLLVLERLGFRQRWLDLIQVGAGDLAWLIVAIIVGKPAASGGNDQQGDGQQNEG